MLCYYEELMEINVSFDEGFEGYLDDVWLKETTEKILVTQSIGNDVEMGLVVASQQKVQQLNKTYRGKDKPTDVLSFTMLTKSSDETKAAFIHPPDGFKHLGEVIFSYPQATMQAEEHLHSIKREVTILIIHGILHLIGYDHIENEPAQQMAAKELAILKTIEGGLD
jgi:probable rRNA maturation factor